MGASRTVSWSALEFPWRLVFRRCVLKGHVKTEVAPWSSLSFSPPPCSVSLSLRRFGIPEYFIRPRQDCYPSKPPAVIAPPPEPTRLFSGLFVDIEYRLLFSSSGSFRDAMAGCYRDHDDEASFVSLDSPDRAFLLQITRTTTDKQDTAKWSARLP